MILLRFHRTFEEDLISPYVSLFTFGVTHMTCCPFQYLTRLSDCSVVMMSFCVMDVMALRSLMLSVPLIDANIKSWSIYRYDCQFR